MYKLSFVIPCYNSAKSIENVISRIEKTVEEDGRYEYEIICSNDFSKDNTLEVLKNLAAQNKRLKVISLSRNFGQHGALMAAFHYVTGDIVVCLDDDGETPPEHVFLLLDKLEEGYDLVSARYEEDKRSFIRVIGSKISFAMSRYLIGRPKDIQLNSFYVFKRYILDEVVKYDNPYPFVHGLILRVTKNMANVDIHREKRISGDSGYTFKKLLGLWMNGFTAFSEKPLRISMFMGIGASLIGFLGAIIVIVRKIIHPEIAAGYSSTMAMILLLFGVMMMMIGLLGEYIGRIYISINNAPQFVVKEVYNVSKEDKLEEGKSDGGCNTSK